MFQSGVSSLPYTNLNTSISSRSHSLSIHLHNNAKLSSTLQLSVFRTSLVIIVQHRLGIGSRSIDSLSLISHSVSLSSKPISVKSSHNVGPKCSSLLYAFLVRSLSFAFLNQSS